MTTVTANHAMIPLILDHFEQVNQIPRGSKNEARISAWLKQWAEERGFEVLQDAALNLLVRVPGTPGYENSPTVVMQGHMDMVCEKEKGSPHDFTKDPIRMVEDGEWLTAVGTTLGADNGIGLAMAMTAATQAGVAHPPLELLFTVDEETGLTGANELQPGYVTGKILLNLDSEDEGVFTIGCAGGRDTKAWFPIERGEKLSGSIACELVVEGLRGGHSGVDIHEQRGNAILVLARALKELCLNGDVQLATIQGGTAHNAIPRDAEAILFVPETDFAACQARIGALQETVRSELRAIDPDVAILLKRTETNDTPWTQACTLRAVDLFLAMPHGVAAYSLDMEGLVETSNNFASLRTEGDEVILHTSQRSSVMTQLDWLTYHIESVERLAGCRVESEKGYPSWQPNFASPLLARCQRLFEELEGRPPKVEVIHAGLECGIIGSKYDGMDMISFGPTIKGPHSPEERIETSTIGKVWDFLAALLADLK